MKFKVIDLFSGIGGFSYGLEATGHFETVAFCEIEKYPQKVLKKHWPGVPIYEDIREMDTRGLFPDIITGGYPCQPFSNAGKQRGEKDPRHLWPEMFRIIKETKPRWILCENVYGHIQLGLDTVLDDLESEGYTTWSFIIPACSVGAPHERKRVFIVANSDSKGSQRRLSRGQNKKWKDKQRHSGRSSTIYGQQRENWCAAEPSVGRVANGIPSRVDRLKGLGNSIVPQIAQTLGEIIIKYETK